MKYILAIVLGIVFHVLGDLQIEKLKTELQLIKTMKLEFEKKGLWKFLDYAHEQNWAMPWIRSDYWVDLLPSEPKERIELESAKRLFGLAIAKSLDDEALQVIKAADVSIREKQAGRLLDAVRWFSGSRGYGNLLLSSRTENLACVPIGYLIADLNCPTNKIDAFMVRLSTPASDLAFRIDVLNEEAPQRININREANVEKGNDELDQIWSRGQLAMMDWCKQEKLPRAKDKLTRRKLPPEFAFFCDDESAYPPYTVTHKWDQKQHLSYCVYGSVKNVRNAIETLYLFRQHVGDFPRNPPEWFGPNEKIYTVIQAAFTQAWEPYRKQHGPVGNYAAQVYESIQKRQFMDWDSSQLVESLSEAQKTNLKK